MPNLRLLPLGGIGKVTQNMYMYEYDDEILIVDCGFGFPDVLMPGVDVLIPDTSYLHELLSAGKRIVGMILTHGHDDHIGALPFILPELPEFPIYASPLTAGFAHNRMKDGKTERAIQVVNDNHVFQISKYFSAQAIKMTHSVPDTRHYAITTPEGVIYHGSDFKLDPSPVDGELPDFDTITKVAQQGVLCMLIDSLRVERSEWTKSESLTGPVIEDAMVDTEGMFILTLMSSHIHRIQQTVNAAEKHHRKVVFVGRSVEQNVEVAMELNKLHIPKGMVVDKREILDHKPSTICVIIAGSQGQEGSSLIRAISGEHPIIQIKPQDKVVFSADVIPGNELNYFGAVDELARNGITVIYPDVEPNIHQSGHASAPEQQELLGLVKPEFVMPIGGADRHRAKFFELVASKLGYPRDKVLTPSLGQVLGFSQGRVQVVDEVPLKSRTVDGLGIGDVGPVVLADRKALSQAGIIVLVLPRSHGQWDLRRMEIISRGFVFMKEADEVIDFIKQTTSETIQELGQKVKDDELKRTIERRLARKLYKIIQREPMIVPVIINL